MTSFLTGVVSDQSKGMLCLDIIGLEKNKKTQSIWPGR